MAIVNAAEVQMTVELLEKRFAKEKIAKKLNAVLIYQTAWNSRWKREDRTALHTKS